MVDCPECGKRLRESSQGKSKYYCENERCIVLFVCHPDEPDRTRIAYTGFALHKTENLVPKELDQQSIRQKLRFF